MKLFQVHHYHTFIANLGRRHQNRPGLEIKDEYDVQDLVRALLCVWFDDVMSEEWTPSYSGKCFRIDFCSNLRAY